MKIIEGGVCAAKGFKAGSVRCGVKESRTNDDTAIIFSECECTAAATYTMNRVKAAPLYVTMEHLEDGVARAIVANAGNANACAPDGMENARRMQRQLLNCSALRKPTLPLHPPVLSASASTSSASRSTFRSLNWRTMPPKRPTVPS